MKILYADINEFETEYLKGLVSKERLERSLKYRQEEDVKRSLLAEALLNYGIKDMYPDVAVPVIPEIDEYKKPHVYTKTGEINYSISHSGDYVVCVISDKPAGIDIEKIGENNTRVAKRFYTDMENQYVTGAASFYNIWTLKESFMKIMGLGMKLPMDAFTVTDLNTASGECRYAQTNHELDSVLMKRLEATGNIYGKIIEFPDAKYALSLCGYLPMGDISIRKINEAFLNKILDNYQG